MSIQFVCECGRSLKVKDESAGRKVRCPTCGIVIVVPTPASSENAADEAINELLAEGPPPASPPKPMLEEDDARFEEEKRPSLPASKPRSMPPDPTREARVPRIKKPDSSYSGISIHPQIIIGVLMMVGAVVWFFAGLAADRIFFYPPILFLLGIGAIIKGFTGRE